MVQVQLKRQDGSFYDITSIFERIILKSSVNQFKKTLELIVVDNKTSPLIPLNPINLTDEIRLVDGETELFRGIVVTEDERRRNQKFYTAYDYAFYFETNKESFYFEDVSYDEAIKEVMDYFGLELRIRVLDSSFRITKFFKTDSIADIINYIFREYKDKTNKELDMIVNGTTFDLLPSKRQDYISGRYQPKEFFVNHFGNPVNIIDMVSTKNQSKSFEKLRNAVKVNSFSKTSVQTEANIEDPTSISTYGRMQEVVTFDYDTDTESPDAIARNVLKDLNKIENMIELSIEKGNYNVTAGEILSINDEVLDLNGAFEVINVSMIWENSNLSMDMTIDEII